MCRGLALGLDKRTNEIVCIGSPHHHETFKDNHDSYVALELLRDDYQDKGYRIELDAQYFRDKKLDNEVYKRHCVYLTKAGKLKKNIRDILSKWETDNLADIYRWLLSCSSHATIEGHQSNNSAAIEGDQYNSSATIERYQYNRYATIKGHQDNYSATIKGEIYLTNCKILTGDKDKKKADKINNWIKDNSKDRLRLSDIILRLIESED